MRISDWSSDVCSSDLHRHDLLGHPLRVIVVILGALQRRNRYRTMRDAKFGKPAETVDDFLPGHAGPCTRIVVPRMDLAHARRRNAIVRKGVVWGKGVSVRVGLGGGGYITKKKKN